MSCTSFSRHLIHVFLPNSWQLFFLLLCEKSEVLGSVQSLSHVRLFVTPWIAAHQASLSITNCQSPPKPMSIELVMPSSHLILCRPLLLLPSIFPSIRVLSNESVLHIRWPKYHCPFPSFSMTRSLGPAVAQCQCLWLLAHSSCASCSVPIMVSQVANRFPQNVPCLLSFISPNNTFCST